jgi:hypothetical protein
MTMLFKVYQQKNLILVKKQSNNKDIFKLLKNLVQTTCYLSKRWRLFYCLFSFFVIMNGGLRTIYVIIINSSLKV